MVIRTDVEPQFRSEFVAFCEDNGNNNELSSPNNPWSNGLSESGVKIVKNFIPKCMNERGEIY